VSAETSLHPQTAQVLAEVRLERIRQELRWGQQNHPDGTGLPLAKGSADYARARCQTAAEDGSVTWEHILTEEHYEAMAEEDPTRLREELIQVAAVAVAWVEAIDRRHA
jgi:malonyl CoA-acyl carrier protein transacylase